MLEPRFRWTFPSLGAGPSPALLLAGSGLGLSERTTGLLASRGVRDARDLQAWFADPLDALHDPHLLPDAEIVLQRVARARDTDETVMVFGDFDADGLTGLAILVLALRALGVTVTPYVPSRLDEGHGLSMAAVDAAERAAATLVITVDCGTTSVAEIAAAVARGIDVIVTDHHQVPAVLPPALAIVNPQRVDSTYPDPRLAGSGVAFKVAQLLLGERPGGAHAALALADLATIGTVADVAPIVGENRAIARIGLERLRTAPRPGIVALLARARVAAADIDLETVSFTIAPRLNAAGRVGEALDAARLLLAADAAEADVHADVLEAANISRRELMKTAVSEARQRVADAGPDPGAAVTIVRGPWSVGIVGLVASRLSEDHGRPAIVGADLGDVVRASCRSDGSLDLGASLTQCSDLFVRHGGHAGAAGFEIAAERWPEFVARFSKIAASAGVPPDPRPALRIDLAIPALDVDYALHRELAALAPHGPGNPDPLIAVLGLTVTRVRAAGTDHTQLTLKRRLDVLDGIAFGRADIAELVSVGDRIDVVARLTSRRFGGYESLQLDVRDAAPAGAHDVVLGIPAAVVA